MVHKARTSHIASAFSIMGILSVLYWQIMRFNSSNSEDSSRVRFILSKGNSCVAVYPTLAKVGFITYGEVETYGDDFSWLMLMNHIVTR